MISDCVATFLSKLPILLVTLWNHSERFCITPGTSYECLDVLQRPRDSHGSVHASFCPEPRKAHGSTRAAFIVLRSLQDNLIR